LRPLRMGSEGGRKGMSQRPSEGGNLHPGGRSDFRCTGTVQFPKQDTESWFNSQAAHRRVPYDGTEQGELAKYRFSGEKCLASRVFFQGGIGADLKHSPCPALEPDLRPRSSSDRAIPFPGPGFPYGTARRQLRQKTELTGSRKTGLHSRHQEGLHELAGETPALLQSSGG